jgi:hypothetical protein
MGYALETGRKDTRTSFAVLDRLMGFARFSGPDHILVQVTD